ncbi:MAG: nitroreductase family protein, partial [Planctomycetota bacterium]
MSSENPLPEPPNQADTDAILRLLGAHRSIRSYTDDPVPEADLAAAVQAGQAAATSSAVQAYCAIRITDPARRARLAELRHARPNGSLEEEQIARLALLVLGRLAADVRR